MDDRPVRRLANFLVSLTDLQQLAVLFAVAALIVSLLAVGVFMGAG